MREISEQREHEMILQKEMQNQSRLMKQQTVERIMRVNEYKKHQILVKIQQDNLRGLQLQQQKAELLNARRQARDDAIRIKESMQQKFEIMQTKGNLDVSILKFITLLAKNFG